MDLPEFLKDLARKVSPTLAQRRGKGRRARVLVIGEDATLKKVYQELFRGHDEEFSCRYAKDGPAAISHLWRGQLDAIVMDWLVGGSISGHDLLLSIRRLPHTRETPVLVVGCTTTEEESEARLHGASDCLPRSAETAILIERLRYVHE